MRKVATVGPTAHHSNRAHRSQRKAKKPLTGRALTRRGDDCQRRAAMNSPTTPQMAIISRSCQAHGSAPAGKLNDASTAVMRWRTGKYPEILASVVLGWIGNHVCSFSTDSQPSSARKLSTEDAGHTFCRPRSLPGTLERRRLTRPTGTRLL